jgi:hypothetical protein
LPTTFKAEALHFAGTAEKIERRHMAVAEESWLGESEQRASP